MSVLISSWSRVETYKKLIVVEPQSSSVVSDEGDSGFSSHHELPQSFLSSSKSINSTQNSSAAISDIPPRRSNKSCKHCVELVLEFGHTAKLRTSPSAEGHTHDWQLLVRSINNEEDKKLGHFIQKVEFQLHDTFASPKIVQKEAPYVISKSGYATFLLFIDIHLKKLSAPSKPNKLRFCYNLVLDSRQSLHCLRYEKLIFVNPGEEFKANLLRAGGVEFRNCGGFLSQCTRCNKSLGITPSSAQNKRRQTSDSGLGGSLEFSGETRTPVNHKKTSSRKEKKSKITKTSDACSKSSKLAAKYKPTPEKLLHRQPAASVAPGIILNTPRNNQGRVRLKKVRFAQEDNVFFEMSQNVKRGRGRPRKYPRKEDGLTDGMDDDYIHRADNFFFEPFASPKKQPTPLQPETVVANVAKKLGRPRKHRELSETSEISSNNVPSFFQSGPSHGTRNNRKTITFTSDPPTFQPFNVTLPNFLVAPNDEDDSGSTDYDDDPDDDDDDIICIEEEKIVPPPIPPPTRKTSVPPANVGPKRRGRPPKKSKATLEGPKQDVGNSPKNPFPMVPNSMLKKKRGRPPKPKSVVSFSNVSQPSVQSNSLRMASIDSALYSSRINNDNEQTNSTQEFSTTILSSNSNILTSTPLKSCNIINSPVKRPTAPDFSRNDEVLNCSDYQVEASHIKEEINEDKLVELQEKLSNLSDPNILRKVVKIIEQSGRFRIDGTIFDFDLCTLDDETVKSLIKCFE